MEWGEASAAKAVWWQEEASAVALHGEADGAELAMAAPSLDRVPLLIVRIKSPISGLYHPKCILKSLFRISISTTSLI